MAEFKLERFKYNWRGSWQSGISYKRDDIVRVNGKSYVCVITHVSSPLFRTDLTATLPGSVPPQPQPKWIIMTEGRSFEGNWQSNTAYNLGDVVLYDGSLWICTLSHTSDTFENNFLNWSLYIKGSKFTGNWQPTTAYGPGALVKYNGIAYKCLNPHTSGTSIVDNISDWEVYHVGVEFKGDWEAGVVYRVNDLVKYGGTIFRCTEEHTAQQNNFDNDRFSIEVFGNQFNDEWVNSVYYNIGDVVRHDGFIYYAVNNNYNSRPFQEPSDLFPNGSPDWILLAKGYNFTGSWLEDRIYKTGDVVLRGGNLYLAKRDIGGVYQDGSTLDYLENDTWELLVPGKAWNGIWQLDTRYSVGDIVYYLGNSYTCNFEHISSIENYPGDNGNFYNFWDVLIQGGRPGGLLAKGDLLTYGLSRPFVGLGSSLDGSTLDTSTIGDTRLEIGSTDQVLSISADLEAYWRHIVEDADTIYVSTNGIDDANRGTYQRPFKTIRYATEYVADNFEPMTPVIIRVSTGKFEEVGPIIVPAGCAINGDELRSTTVIASGPKAPYQDDYQYVDEYLTYFESILLDIITGNAITSPLNTVQQQVLDKKTVQIDPVTGNPVLSLITGLPIEITLPFPAASLDAANIIADRLVDFRNYVEFRIANGEVNTTLSGSNTETEDQTVLNAREGLLLNKDFIQEELLAFIKLEHPDVQFDDIRVKGDVWSIIRGLMNDIRYSGNYGTLTAALRYANSVTGSKLENMFLMRDSTGLRDLTMEGLQGILNPPGVFDLYQKPTGGACVSLDPGWGPNDEKTWIINRSPYMQGVTNIGTGCVGCKIDGALHNGGNRSMVANDFTQVLSDGIGAWVTNNARAELVSVFTYYCQIGYFAEDGGIIRATNGNNSYGRYGAIADGADDREIPQEATINNKDNEAQVIEAFAGGSADQIFLFEYSNAGEEYTVASATISGAGANANVEYTDFRDGGIFEVRLGSPDGSSSKSGSGYLIRQGSAQETLDASSTLKLSQNDPTQFLSEIEGMRVIITDGLGVGQYGYISGFDFTSRNITVRKESDATLGWDHIVPGTPLVSAFDLTTRYRIEPRITVSAPVYASQSYDLFTNRTYVDVTFGNTTQTYTNITGSGSYLWEDDVQTSVLVSQIVSPTALQFSGQFLVNPTVPFNIKGKTTGTTATVEAITANTGTIIEVNVSGNGNSFEVGERLEIITAAGTGNTFDDDPVPAIFNVTRAGETYSATLTNPGAGYRQNDKIIFLGTQFGGTTPENDLTITVTSVSLDSTNSIQSFTVSGKAREGSFVSLTSSEYFRFSEDGINWTEGSMSFIGDYRKILNGNNRFIAVANGESRVASSLTGQTWTNVSLPLSAGWSDGVYGGGKFVIVANDTDVVLSSTNGVTWSTGSIPNDTVGDSTISQWTRVTYGKGKYVAVSANDRATATSSNGTSWTRHDLALPDLAPSADWDIVSIAYGNNRFLILDSTGRTAYSFDGITWYQGADTQNALSWSNMKYSQGVFVAIAGGNGTNALAETSEDGLSWTSRVLPSTQLWSALTYSRKIKKWVLLASGASTNGIAHINVGARAKCRADVVTGGFNLIKIWDPGSGYSESNLPEILITDPNPTVTIAPEPRLGDKVLSQPDFINRGSGYRKSSSIITITGNGYADIIPEGNVIKISGIERIPGPGVQIRITGILEPFTPVEDDLKIFSGVEVTDLGDDGSGNGTRLVQFTITPSIKTENNLVHGTTVTLREKYSQCRITGHDFLDIGTGNFEETNYPDIYAGGNFFTALPENEVYEANSGRVFYTSTDQDGNFRTGELFAVNQATGVVTISAQFFDLQGLSELALGGVRLGGSGTVVNEFSTDGTFAADSNNIIPTQRAIVTFLANRLSVGGENLEVNRLVAGRIALGGDTNEIDNTTNGYLKIPSTVVFDRTYQYTDTNTGSLVTAPVGITGTIVSQMLFLKRFDQSMQ